MRIISALAALLLVASPALAQRMESVTLDVVSTDSDTESPVLSLLVSGQASAKPDRATISGGVESESPNASEAMKLNNAKMASVIRTIRAAGVDPSDIQTSSVSLRRNVVWEDEKRVNKGFKASNSVNVRIRDISEMGTILQAIVDSGATNVRGPNFSLQDDSKLTEEARSEAIGKAQTLAASYATQTGFREARLFSIAEGGSSDAGMIYNAVAVAEAAADSYDSVPVQAGEVTKTVTISVKYRLVK